MEVIFGRYYNILGKQNIWSNYSDLALFFTRKVAEEGKSPSQDYPCWRNIIIWPDSSHDINLSQVHISQNAPHVFRIFTYHLASNLWDFHSHGAYGAPAWHPSSRNTDPGSVLQHQWPDLIPVRGTQRSRRLHPGYWKTSRSIPIRVPLDKWTQEVKPTISEVCPLELLMK